MQEKINKLTDIIKSIKSEPKKNYAIKLLSEIVDTVNNQNNEIDGLMAWKTNNKKIDIECELQKYVLLLILYGYSQKWIKSIRTETLIFIAKHRSKFDHFKADEIKTIDLMLMNYEFDNNKTPETYELFKNYYDAVKG